jgi:hypothetical protein
LVPHDAKEPVIDTGRSIAEMVDIWAIGERHLSFAFPNRSCTQISLMTEQSVVSSFDKLEVMCSRNWASTHVTGQFRHWYYAFVFTGQDGLRPFSKPIYWPKISHWILFIAG